METHACPNCGESVEFEATIENCPNCGKWLMVNDSAHSGNVTVLSR